MTESPAAVPTMPIAESRLAEAQRAERDAHRWLGFELAAALAFAVGVGAYTYAHHKRIEAERRAEAYRPEGCPV